MTSLGKEVPLEDIAQELKALWADTSERTNACMMNLAVFTEDVTQLEKNSENIAVLTRNHSCRALSIALDRHAEEKSITSWLTAHCNMSNGKKTVCCEQLTFLLKGYQPGRMRNTVFANLNSDLPLIFWWQGELSEGFEPRLYTLIDRFVFDSAEWADPVAGYRRLLEAASDVQRRFVMQDLAWTRSHSMRLSVAALFDDSSAQEELLNIRNVTIHHNKDIKTSALLMLSWLAIQVQWIFLRKQDGQIIFQNKQGNEVIAQIKQEGERSISKVELLSEKASFTVHYNSKDGFFHQYINCPAGSHEMTSFAGESDTITLLADQLSRGGKNKLLRKTIPMFLNIY